MKSQTSWWSRLLHLTSVFGLGVALVGLVILSSFLPFPRDEQVEHLTRSTAHDLQNATPGEHVLVEGHMSHDTPPQLEDLVAYVGEHQSRGRWSITTRVAPPLLVATTRGVVRVGEGYRLFSLPVTVPHPSQSDERYRGFVVGSRVLVVGTARQHNGTMQVDASLVYGGTRDAFVAANRRATMMTERLAPALIGGGLVVFVLLFWVNTLGRVGQFLVSLIRSPGR